MRERDVNRRYHLELGGALAIYGVVLFTAIYFANRLPTGPVRTALVVTPMVPVVLAAWAIARHFGRVDEFVRLRSLQNIAVAAAVTAGWTLTYGFLEGVGYPRLSMFWVWPVMGAVWSITELIRRLVRR